MSKRKERSNGWLPQWHPMYGNVCFVPVEAEQSVHDNYLSGWYYADETDGLNGPFASAEDAKEALDEYLENYQ